MSKQGDFNFLQWYDRSGRKPVGITKETRNTMNSKEPYSSLAANELTGMVAALRDYLVYGKAEDKDRVIFYTTNNLESKRESLGMRIDRPMMEKIAVVALDRWQEKRRTKQEEIRALDLKNNRSLDQHQAKIALSVNYIEYFYRELVESKN